MRRRADRLFGVEEAAVIGDRLFFSRLLDTGVLFITATKRLLSVQYNLDQIKEYLMLHQNAELELKSLRLVVAHRKLTRQIGNIKGNKPRHFLSGIENFLSHFQKSKKLYG